VLKKQSKLTSKKKRAAESIPDKLPDFPPKLPKSTGLRLWKLDLQRSIVRAAKSDGKKGKEMDPQMLA